eukprot:CAMPEP_0175895954 /NCGR_PEP_ID=MMETSP0107_2-20121207/50784_1 /TAXON_ID=195067 ORGANISM="Goniomonas pacifica, Strain CCMP1869" /NCGR_SAMPLE_ID=MMETSP0107_2 /ASSEMBLY_ACC=CAM_ASM_000203 /LENGTH=169 /DNA_ID=CAMNT_0017217115 /DNA_START=711 /DNA_END=1221 /DNA_ORIENTATION=+
MKLSNGAMGEIFRKRSRVSQVRTTTPLVEQAKLDSIRRTPPGRRVPRNQPKQQLAPYSLKSWLLLFYDVDPALRPRLDCAPRTVTCESPAKRHFGPLPAIFSARTGLGPNSSWKRLTMSNSFHPRKEGTSSISTMRHPAAQTSTARSHAPPHYCRVCIPISFHNDELVR